jgi:hypothetical protein
MNSKSGRKPMPKRTIDRQPARRPKVRVSEAKSSASRTTSRLPSAISHASDAGCQRPIQCATTVHVGDAL